MERKEPESSFEQVGYPSIRIYDDRFEFKAVNFWEFRPYYYAELKSLSISHPRDSIWGEIRYGTSGRIYTDYEDPSILKIVKRSGAKRTYRVHHSPSEEFLALIESINERIAQS